MGKGTRTKLRKVSGSITTTAGSGAAGAMARTYSSDRGQMEHIPIADIIEETDISLGESFLNIIESFPNKTGQITSGVGSDARTLEIIHVRTNLTNAGVFRKVIESAISKFYPREMIERAFKKSDIVENPKFDWIVLFKIFPTIGDLRTANIDSFTLSEPNSGCAMSIYVPIDMSNKTVLPVHVDEISVSGMRGPDKSIACLYGNGVLCAPPSIRQKYAITCSSRPNRIHHEGPHARMGVIEFMLNLPAFLTPVNIFGNLPRPAMFGTDPKSVKCYIRDSIKSVADRARRNARNEQIVVRSETSNALVRITRDIVDSHEAIEWSSPHGDNDDGASATTTSKYGVVDVEDVTLDRNFETVGMTDMDDSEHKIREVRMISKSLEKLGEMARENGVADRYLVDDREDGDDSEIRRHAEVYVNNCTLGDDESYEPDFSGVADDI